MELARLVREHQASLIESAMTARGWMRTLWLRASQSEVSPAILERLREIVRADITQQDEDRLRDKGLEAQGSKT